MTGNRSTKGPLKVASAVLTIFIAFLNALNITLNNHDADDSTIIAPACMEGGRLLCSLSVTGFRLDENKWNVLQPKQM